VTWTASQNGKSTAISQTTTDILAEPRRARETTWTPLKGGSWHIEAVIQTANGAPRTITAEFPVATQVVSIEELLSLKGQLPAEGLLVVLFAVCLIFSAVVLFRLIFREQPEQ